MQDSQCQAHHLQVLATGRRANVSGLGPHIKRDCLLEPWHQEVCSLVHHLVRYTLQTIEDDCSSATLNIVDGCAGEREGDGGGDGVAVDLVQHVGHLARLQRWGAGLSWRLSGDDVSIDGLQSRCR